MPRNAGLAASVLCAAVLVGLGIRIWYAPETLQTVADTLSASGLPIPSAFSGPLPSIFNNAELQSYDGSDSSKPLLLCILGEVFDVSGGAKFYGKGEGYNIFLGQDASRSFHSGDWKDPNPDVRDLNVMAIADVIGWRDFYRKHKTYFKVGVLAGLYYDEEGKATEALATVEKMGQEAEAVRKYEESLQQLYPGCDMKHDSKKHSTWISCGSHGGTRYPRLFTWTHKGSGNVAKRCACFTSRELTRPVEAGTLSEYSECPPSAVECTFTQH
jgi:hypothetical protein